MHYRIETGRKLAIELPTYHYESDSPLQRQGGRQLLSLFRSAKESTTNKVQREHPARQARPIGVER
jgi:hypothetical protein